MGTDASRLAQARYREKNRERLNQYQRDRKLALRQEALRQYGDKCNRCGYNEDHRALQIDHIDNDGAEERKRLGGQKFSGWKFYDFLKKSGWPPGYQTLCANCNLLKHLDTLVA